MLYMAKDRKGKLTNSYIFKIAKFHLTAKAFSNLEIKIETQLFFTPRSVKQKSPRKMHSLRNSFYTHLDTVPERVPEQKQGSSETVFLHRPLVDQQVVLERDWT